MNYQYKAMESEGDLLTYRDAFYENGSPKDVDRLRWMHFDNHQKRPMTTIVKDEGRNVAAIYATLPVIASVAGERVSICQSLDTMTDLKHRGKGLFVSAAKSQYLLSKSEGVGFVYGFPNGKSVHGFLKHLGWNLLDPVPFIFKPIRAGYFFRKILGNTIGKLLDFPIAFRKKVDLNSNFEIKPVNLFDDEYNALWQVFSSDINIAVSRDSKYLNWRYINKPNEDYKIVALYENNRLRGFVVYCLKQKHGGKVGYIMELITDLDSSQHARILLDHANNDLIASKCEVVLAWCFDFSPNAEVFKRIGFFSLPSKLRSIELHFGYSNFNCKDSVLAERENWYLSYSDSDTV